MHERALDVRVGLVAARQAGAFTWGQARDCGFGKATISRRVRSGEWLRMYPGVYVLAGAPPGRRRDLWVAVLAVGPNATVSHESGALLHGARHLAQQPLTLTAPHGSHHRLARIVVHQIDDLAARHRTLVDGLPVVTAARAVVELGSRLRPDRLGEVADDLVQLRATSWPAIGRVFRDLAPPGPRPDPRPGRRRLPGCPHRARSGRPHVPHAVGGDEARPRARCAGRRSRMGSAALRPRADRPRAGGRGRGRAESRSVRLPLFASAA